ncbi:hypothetical protein Tco_1429740 [Tanacetum coccineum]
MVACLQKTKGSEGFHQIVDFLDTSHIKYALTENPTIYVSLINQFCQTATARTLTNGEVEITATIDGQIRLLLRHQLGGISSSKILKGHFSPQWRFLIHTILHCLSSKKTAWEQFSSNIATAIFCLATNRTFNFSKLIFDGMVKSLVSKGSIVCVESHHTPTCAPSTSPPPISPTSRIPIRQEYTVPQPRSPTQTHVANEVVSTCVNVIYGGATTTVTSLDARQSSGNIDKTPSMPYDLPLLRGHTLGSNEGSMQLQELIAICTQLSNKVESLEIDLKQTKHLYGLAFYQTYYKEDLEDPSKQGRKIAKIDQDPDISLVQHDAKVQGRHEHDMESNFEFTAAEEVYTAEKGVSTAEPVTTTGAAVTTTSASISTANPPRGSTADDINLAKTLVYIRRSAAKDKCKAKMDESEPVQTKTKLQQKQERLSYEAAMRLQEQLNEEERQRISKVHEEASSFNVEK